MDPATTASPGLALSTQTAGGITIVKLSGELDIACVPALRERLLGMLRPSATRLVVDLSRAIVKTCGSRSFRLLRAGPPRRVVRRVCR